MEQAATHNAPAAEVVRKARSAHIRWRAYAQALVSGVAVDADKAPVHHAECAFGRWFRGEGLQQFGDLVAFHDVGRSHERLHAVYAEIHDLVTRGEMREARARFDEILEVSRELLGALGQLEGAIGGR